MCRVVSHDIISLSSGNALHCPGVLAPASAYLPFTTTFGDGLLFCQSVRLARMLVLLVLRAAADGEIFLLHKVVQPREIHVLKCPVHQGCQCQ
jgi:hypothetical protein